MPVRVLLPKSLRLYWNGAAAVDVEARNLAEAFARLSERYPGLHTRILDDQGRLREYVHVFVNRDAVQGAPELVALRPGDTVHILPSVAGGS